MINALILGTKWHYKIPYTLLKIDTVMQSILTSLYPLYILKHYVIVLTHTLASFVAYFMQVYSDLRILLVYGVQNKEWIV